MEIIMVTYKKRLEREKKRKIIGEGNQCPNCVETLMERRGHKSIPNKVCYYIKWDYCKNCGHIQHYDEFKSEAWKKKDGYVVSAVDAQIKERESNLKRMRAKGL